MREISPSLPLPSLQPLKLLGKMDPRSQSSCAFWPQGAPACEELGVPREVGCSRATRALLRGLRPGPMAALSLSTLPSSKGHRCLMGLLVAAGRLTHVLLTLCGMGHSRPCTPVTHMSSSQLWVSGFSGALDNKVLGPVPSSPTAAQTD